VEASAAFPKQTARLVLLYDAEGFQGGFDAICRHPSTRLTATETALLEQRSGGDGRGDRPRSFLIGVFGAGSARKVSPLLERPCPCGLLWRWNISSSHLTAPAGTLQAPIRPPRARHLL